MFKPKTTLTCLECNTTIWSRYEGEFTVCKCWTDSNGAKGIFIDETEHYTRRGGNMMRVLVGDYEESSG